MIEGTVSNERGVALGSPYRAFPGLTQSSKKLHDFAASLESELAVLEAQAYELGTVRPTLLLNFGPVAGYKYGASIVDSGTTMDLLMQVLTQLTGYGKPQTEAKGNGN